MAPAFATNQRQLARQLGSPLGSPWFAFAGGTRRTASGLALHNGRIFVSDHATGDIVAYSLDGTELARVNSGAPGITGIGASENINHGKIA